MNPHCHNKGCNWNKGRQSCSAPREEGTSRKGQGSQWTRFSQERLLKRSSLFGLKVLVSINSTESSFCTRQLRLQLLTSTAVPESAGKHAGRSSNSMGSSHLYPENRPGGCSAGVIVSMQFTGGCGG